MNAKEPITLSDLSISDLIALQDYLLRQIDNARKWRVPAAEAETTKMLMHVNTELYNRIYVEFEWPAN